MSEQFDPYRKWLGIPPQDQPPHNYRLLGIPLFEDDPDVIENAADRQMAHVRTYQSGQHAAASQKILNQLSAAKLCLLDATQKSAYDEQLKAQVSPAPPTAPPAAPPAAPPPAREPAATAEVPPHPVAPVPVPADVGVALPTRPAPRPTIAPNGATPVTPATPAMPIAGVPAGTTSTRGRGRSKSSPLPMIMIGGAVALLLIALLAVGMSLNGPGGSGDEPAPVTERGNWDPVATDFPIRDDRQDRRPSRPRPPKQPPTTDFGLPMPSAGGGQDDPPNDFVLPSPAELVRKSLADTREALRVRDLKLARNHFDEADRAKVDPLQSSAVEDMRVLLMYYDGVAQAARRGAGTIKADTEFQLGGRTVAMVDVQGDRITYRDGTAEQEIAFSELTPEDILAFARQSLDPDDSLSKLKLATFLAFDGQGDRIASLTEAKRLWREAADDGLRNEALARELGIYDGISVRPMPDEDVLGLGPRPFPGLEPDTDRVDAEPDDAPDNAGPPRTPVPALADLRTARARVLNNYRLDIARARFPKEKSQLAKDIYQAALGEQDDAYRYALLEKARDIAVDMAVPEALAGIVDEMASRFDIDAAAEKADSLNKAIVAADTVVQNAQIYEQARKLYDEAIEDGNYEAAAKLAEAAERAARKANQAGALKTAEEDVKRVRELLDAKRKIEAARETLQTKPEDPDANETLGRHLCFEKEDWHGGLPHLEKAADEQLKQLATTEIENPRDPAAQTALADAWLAHGEKTSGPDGDAMRRRALARYRHIARFLEGDEKVRVDQRIAELGAELDVAPQPAAPSATDRRARRRRAAPEF